MPFKRKREAEEDGVLLAISSCRYVDHKNRYDTPSHKVTVLLSIPQLNENKKKEYFKIMSKFLHAPINLS